MSELRAKSIPFSSDILQILSGKNFLLFVVYLKTAMHLKPPWVLVPKVTCNEGSGLKKYSPTNEHENTM